ncbi:MAG: esterase-like activity of phytase family protein, partial [Chitinophagaceae bacterium]
SSRGPARFYTAKINITAKGIDTVLFTGMTKILDRNAHPYPDITNDRAHSADLEAMRYDAPADLLVRSSEGQRVLRDGKSDLQDPDIIIMDRDGGYKDSFALPPRMRIVGNDKGPRHNGVFEGLDFDYEDQSLWVSVENTIYDDGHDAGPGDSTAWVRFLKFDMKTRTPLAQYAYRVDAVPHVPVPAGGFRINGISDILYLGKQRFIVIERAYSTGREETDVKVFLADIGDAEDVTGKSLAVDTVKRAMTKQLLFDLNSLDFPIQNMEGVTFGPKLPNGNRSLIFVSDNNFSSREQTHFLLFEVIEK